MTCAVELVSVSLLDASRGHIQRWLHCCAGIGLSNDKVLQSRALSYADTQRYRIGTNYQMLPINAPKCPFHNSHENGAALASDSDSEYP